MVSPDILSPTPTTSIVKAPENTEKDTDDPEAADEGGIQMEYSSDNCVAEVQEQ